ncbi:MAG: hypothetical protein CMJ25_16845 [Phycisphaerae bacterium]|nr:hypothetical protein [Phycisphaerae bacterium]
MRFKRRKGRQITRAKKHVVDGITFASGLEVYCYRALKKAKIPNQYEGKTFELVEKFKFDGLLMDKGKTKGKTVYKEKTGNVRNISYTPDFINLDKGFIIETKGLRTAEFKMRFKLFLKYLYDTDQHLDVYVPSNQKEVDSTINLILNRCSFRKRE